MKLFLSLFIFLLIFFLNFIWNGRSVKLVRVKLFPSIRVSPPYIPCFILLDHQQIFVIDLWKDQTKGKLDLKVLISNPALDFKTFDPKLPYLGKFSLKIESDTFSSSCYPIKFEVTDVKSSNGFWNFQPYITLCWANLIQKPKMFHFQWELVPDSRWQCWFQIQS